MPKILCKIDQSPIVACSGGADSLAALLFVHNYAKRKPVCLFIDHGTKFSKQSLHFVSDVCEKLNIALTVYEINEKPPKGESKEHWWGLKRSEIYRVLAPRQVITGHTFDDAVEKFIMKSLSGSAEENRFHNIRTRNNVYSPFLLWTKKDCRNYLTKHGISWIDDPTNFDGSNLRSWMRMSSFVDVCEERFHVKSVVKKEIERQYNYSKV